MTRSRTTIAGIFMEFNNNVTEERSNRVKGISPSGDSNRLQCANLMTSHRERKQYNLHNKTKSLLSSNPTQNTNRICSRAWGWGVEPLPPLSRVRVYLQIPIFYCAFSPLWTKKWARVEFEYNPLQKIQKSDLGLCCFLEKSFGEPVVITEAIFLQYKLENRLAFIQGDERITTGEGWERK